MLYEMVTGRPPFVGDEAIAVISPAPQHAAGRAVLAPTRLPAGARSADPAAAREGPGESAPHRRRRCSQRAGDASSRAGGRRPTPLATRTRSTGCALRRLRRPRERAGASCGRLRRAALGHGGLVMVVGEPGIGKTRTTRAAGDLRDDARRARCSGAARTSPRARRRTGRGSRPATSTPPRTRTTWPTVIGPQMTPDAIAN